MTIFAQSEVMKLREQLESLTEHDSPKQDRERVLSFTEHSFVDSTSHDEVQCLKSVLSKLQQEKQQSNKSVNDFL